VLLAIIAIAALAIHLTTPPKSFVYPGIGRNFTPSEKAANYAATHEAK
jgi:hypothetical protein